MDKEFLYETDDDKDMIDEIIRCIGEQAECENNRNAILNPVKARELFAAYQILTRITRGTKVKVSYTMNEPYISMGVVSVEGNELTFDKPKLFKAAAGFASNLNIYPKTDGTIRMDFTFHNLTTPLE